ncbi:uncharacterized protein [Canis lupus baileyi]|uniref:uncharacterized protein isoform X2 n=1 Tax=Canis lupus baileyi TaxID=143281 RepID=UPI003B977B15
MPRRPGLHSPGYSLWSGIRTGQGKPGSYRVAVTRRRWSRYLAVSPRRGHASGTRGTSPQAPGSARHRPSRPAAETPPPGSRPGMLYCSDGSGPARRGHTKPSRVQVFRASGGVDTPARSTTEAERGPLSRAVGFGGTSNRPRPLHWRACAGPRETPHGSRRLGSPRPPLPSPQASPPARRAKPRRPGPRAPSSHRPPPGGDKQPPRGDGREPQTSKTGSPGAPAPSSGGRPSPGGANRHRHRRRRRRTYRGRGGRERPTVPAPFTGQTTALEGTASPHPPALSASAHARAGSAPWARGPARGARWEPEFSSPFVGGGGGAGQQVSSRGRGAREHLQALPRSPRAPRWLLPLPSGALHGGARP